MLILRSGRPGAVLEPRVSPKQSRWSFPIKIIHFSYKRMLISRSGRPGAVFSLGCHQNSAGEASLSKSFTVLIRECWFRGPDDQELFWSPGCHQNWAGEATLLKFFTFLIRECWFWGPDDQELFWGPGCHQNSAGEAPLSKSCIFFLRDCWFRGSDDKELFSTFFNLCFQQNFLPETKTHTKSEY